MTLNIEPLTSIDSINFTEKYQEIGKPLPKDAVKIRIQNLTNQSIYISTDGFTDHEYLDINQILVIDSNTSIPSFASGTQFYVKALPGEGNEGLVFFSVYFVL